MKRPSSSTFVIAAIALVALFGIDSITHGAINNDIPKAGVTASEHAVKATS